MADAVDALEPEEEHLGSSADHLHIQLQARGAALLEHGLGRAVEGTCLALVAGQRERRRAE